MFCVRFHIERKKISLQTDYIIQLERDKSWSEEHPYISTIKQPSIADFAKNGCFFLIFSLRIRGEKITVLRIALLTRKVIMV